MKIYFYGLGCAFYLNFKIKVMPHCTSGRIWYRCYSSTRQVGHLVIWVSFNASHLLYFWIYCSCRFLHFIIIVSCHFDAIYDDFVQLHCFHWLWPSSSEKMYPKGYLYQYDGKNKRKTLLVLRNRTYIYTQFDSQNTGNSVSELPDFKFFWRGMPPDPP